MRSWLSRSLNKKKKGENSIILVESIFGENIFFAEFLQRLHLGK